MAARAALKQAIGDKPFAVTETRSVEALGREPGPDSVTFAAIFSLRRGCVGGRETGAEDHFVP